MQFLQKSAQIETKYSDFPALNCDLAPLNYRSMTFCRLSHGTPHPPFKETDNEPDTL